MNKERFQVGKTPSITITRCTGDLVIRPWMELDVRAKGDFDVEQSGTQLTFESTTDLVLNVPEGAAVHLENGHGDVVIRSLSGDISLAEVSGDLILGNVGYAKVGQVGGDMVARNLSGSLSVEHVGGDAVARNIDGDLSFAEVGGDVIAQFISGALTINAIMGDIHARSVNGDLEIIEGGRDVNLRNLGGRCTVKKVAGDIRLKGGLGPYDHSLRAGGDFVLIWPVEAPLLLEAQASEIDNRLPLLDVDESDSAISGRLGEGKTRLTVFADGRLVLKEALMVSKQWNFNGDNFFEFDFVADLAGLGEAISSEVQDQVARVTAELENNFGSDFVQQMATQFSQKAGAAADKAREAAEGARQQSEKRASGRGKGASSASGKGSQEAQLKILKMVEDGIISPDEANMLLQALDGD